MWYDLLIAAILIFCAVRGARRGLLWQIAGIGGLILAFLLAETVSPTLTQYLNLGPTLNRWVAMLAVYLGASFVTFAVARSLKKSLEKAQFAEFDRHLGMLFGAIKGVLLAIVVSFFAVTLEQTRPVVLASYSGYTSAVVLNELKPVLPAELAPYLDPYLEDFEGVENPWEDGFPLRIDAEAADRAIAADDLRREEAGPITLDDIRARFGGYARDRIAELLTGATEREGDRIMGEVAAATPEEVLNVIDRLAGGMATGGAVPEPTEGPSFRDEDFDFATDFEFKADRDRPSFERPDVAGPTDFGPNPLDRSPFAPEIDRPRIGVPDVRVPSPADFTRTLDEIAAIYNDVPDRRAAFVAEAVRRLGSVPPSLQAEVVADWYADLTGRGGDPEPSTDITTPLTTRIARHRDAAGRL